MKWLGSQPLENQVCPLCRGIWEFKEFSALPPDDDEEEVEEESDDHCGADDCREGEDEDRCEDSDVAFRGDE